MALFGGTIPAGPARLLALLLLASLLAATSSAPPPQQSGPSPAPLRSDPSSPDPGRDQRGPPSSPAMGRTQALSLGLASTASPRGAHTATPEHPGTGSGRTRATESEGRQTALPAASTARAGLSARSVDGPAAPAGRGPGLNQPVTPSTPPSTPYSSQGVPQKQTRKSPSTTVLVRQEVAGGNSETPVKTDQEPHSTPPHNPLLPQVSPQGFQTSGPEWTPAFSSVPLIREPPDLTLTSAPAARTLPAPQNPTVTAPRQPLVSAVPEKETHPSNVTPMASSTPQPGRGETTMPSEETELTSSQGTPAQHSPCTNHHTASPRGHAPSGDITTASALGVGLPAGGGLITPGKATEEPITTAGVITEGADWLTGAESFSLSTAGREEDRWGVDGSTAVAPTMHSDGVAYFQPQAQTRSVKNPPGVTTATKEPSTSADHLLGTGSSGTLAQSQPTAPFGTTQVQQPQTPTQPSANPGLSSRSGDKMVTPVPRTPVSTPPPARKTKPPRATVAGVTELQVTPGLEDTGSRVSVTSSSSLPAVGGAEPTTASQQPKTVPGDGGASTPAPKAGRGFEPDEILLEGAVPRGSIPLGPPAAVPSPSLAPEPPCPAGSSGPCLPGPNRTVLLWADLRRTLSFSWELHVFSSAALSLLLALGAAAGLLATPALRGPPRGCLALANAGLLLAGSLRALGLLADPYGSRELLPRPAVTGLYNLPFPLLLWALAALCLLALQGAGLRLLPASLQRPPLAAVLALLHCTLLLAADLLSGALSPLVPVVLQALSVSWGVFLCAGFLLAAFPRLRRRPGPTPGPAPGPREEPACGRVGWAQAGAGQRLGRVLSRVLCVCAVLGALCCGLQAQAGLWLYGLLGDWRRFSWAWWLGQFWFRLLELAWAFSMLLVSSWLFWRPVCREQGGTGAAAAEGGGEEAALSSSSGSSSSSSQRHTCWAKIVQSLRGRPYRKAESNGVGAAGTGSGDNQSSQDRPGADISKCLIRSRAEQLPLRSLKDSSHGRGQQGGSTGSLLQALGRPGGLLCAEREKDAEKESILSFADFDLRPPSPIDLRRSIDEALPRGHLLRDSLFGPALSPPPSPGAPSGGPRRCSNPELRYAAGVSTATTGGSLAAPAGGAVTPDAGLPAAPGSGGADTSSRRVPPSLSCPVSFTLSRASAQARPCTPEDDTVPFLSPGAEGDPDSEARRSFLEISRQADSVSVSSDTIDL